MELSANDQTLGTVDTARGTQLGEQELGDVLIVTLHAFADIGDVGENGLLVSFAENLGRRNLVAASSIAGKVGVLASEKGEESGEEKGVGEIDSAGGVPDTSSGDQIPSVLGVEDLNGLLGVLSVARDDTSLGELGVEIGFRNHLLLFLLLHRGGVELPISSGSAILILLRLLLLGEVFEGLGELVDVLVLVCTCRCAETLAAIHGRLALASSPRHPPIPLSPHV